MENKTKNDLSGNTRKHDRLIWASILTLILVAMSFTPLGYLNISTVSVTFLPVIVVIGAIHAGPVCGLYLGTVFGVTSFIHCFTDYQFGKELLDCNMLGAAVVCIVPRALMGWCCGGIYRLFSRSSAPVFAKFVSSFSGGFLNTVFYGILLYLFFGSSECILSIGDSATTIIRSLISSNAFIEWFFCTVVGMLTPVIKNNHTASDGQSSSELDFFGI